MYKTTELVYIIIYIAHSSEPLHFPYTRWSGGPVVVAVVALRVLRTGPSETEVSDALDQVAAHSVNGTFRCKQRGSLRGCFLHPEQTDAGSVPDTHGAGGRARRGAHDHFAGEDKSPKQGLVPSHRQGGPFERVNTDGRRIRDDRLHRWIVQEGRHVRNQGTCFGIRHSLKSGFRDVGGDGRDDG